jgi:hypothetical protein
MTAENEVKQVEAAIKSFEMACIRNHKEHFETVLGIPVSDILRSLRIHRALLQEPSMAMTVAALSIPKHKCDLLPFPDEVFKAMAAKLIEEQTNEST